MISKRNKDLLDFLNKRFGLKVEHYKNPEAIYDYPENCIQVIWSDGMPDVSNGSFGCIPEDGADINEAIQNLLEEISGKDLFQVKNKRWCKKVSLPEFSCLSELKMKLMIESGKEEQ